MNNLDSVVQQLINIANKSQEQKKQQQPYRQKKSRLPDPKLTLAQLYSMLKVLAIQYQTDVVTLIRKLDRASGNINYLNSYYETKDQKYLWASEEDELLGTKSQQILIKYKGQQIVQQRKNYLTFKLQSNQNIKIQNKQKSKVQSNSKSKSKNRIKDKNKIKSKSKSKSKRK